MNVLVDTSIWSLVFRRKPTDLNTHEKSIVVEFEELVKEERARIIGIVRLELLTGIKTAAQYEKVLALLGEFRDEIIATSDYEAAAKCANDCMAKGIAVSLPDILICEVALSRGFSIFTTDSDFQNYAKVLPIQFHVPRR